MVAGNSLCLINSSQSGKLGRGFAKLGGIATLVSGDKLDSLKMFNI